MLLDMVKLQKRFLSEWGRRAGQEPSVQPGDVTVLVEPVRGAAMPKCFRTFFLPGHRTQYL